jgi:hypothetical protein
MDLAERDQGIRVAEEIWRSWTGRLLRLFDP